MPSPYRERRSDLHNPQDAGERFNERYEQHCADFRNKVISVDVFRAHLYGLGFRSYEIEGEVNLHYPT